MSGGTEALMRTRCPVCGTVFRATSGQLRLKAGKVRCGHCQALFNAFDHLLPAEAGETAEMAPDEAQTADDASPLPQSPPPSEPSGKAPALLPPQVPADRLFILHPRSTAEEESKPPADPRAEDVLPDLPDLPSEPTAKAGVTTLEEAPPVKLPLAPKTKWTSSEAEAGAEPASETQTPAKLSPASETEAGAVAPSAPAFNPTPSTVNLPVDPAEAPDPLFEPLPNARAPAAGADATAAPEALESTAQAAREAGLSAVRDLSETPAFNRWASGTLAGEGPAFANDGSRPRSLFMVAAMLLAILLVLQLAYHFRREIVRHLPLTASLYAALSIDIPVAKNVDLLGIESSDLQADAARGLFVLQATLKNRAHYAQAWPQLELTLTDVQDAVLARRVLNPADYLPPGRENTVFNADEEVMLRLWLEALNTPASGYRLYLFYP